MYIEGFVYAVPLDNKEAFIEYASKVAPYFKKHGATRVVEGWEDEVPDGELTSFPMAVKRKEGEAVLFSWVEWPSKQVRDDAHSKIVADLEKNDLPDMMFDGKRMIFGGFTPVVDQ